MSSFFQQSHNSKRRSNLWSNNRPNRTALSETTANTVSTKPPSEPASQTKAELTTTETNTATSGRQTRQAQDGGQGQVSSENGSNQTSIPINENENEKGPTPQLIHANTFPSTPAVRLSLEELIGGYEEVRPAVRLASPEEQIGWIPNSSSTLLTPNRRRKRARSSSPSCPTTSSQRNEGPSFLPDNAVGVDEATTNADPTAELWQKFRAGRDDKDILKLPDISHLVFQASPRPIETPAKASGFRRWASTGNDWPSSRSKRRRTTTKPNWTLWQDEEVKSAGTNTNKSKVATLVEQLKESLATQNLAKPKLRTAINTEEPSSSSPLPHVGGSTFNGRHSGSPLRDKTHQAQQISDPSSPNTSPPAKSARPQPLRSNQISPYMKGHASAMPQDSFISAPLHLQSKAPLPAFKRPSISRTSSKDAQKGQTACLQGPNIVTEDNEFDEFDEGFDFSVEEFEELISQAPPLHPAHRGLHAIAEAQEAETQHSGANCISSISLAPLNDPELVAAFDPDDDDDFGDGDLDEESFAEAEITATQAATKLGISYMKQTNLQRSMGVSTPKAESVAGIQSMGQPMPGSHRRMQVKQVVHGDFSDDKGCRHSEHVILTEDEATRLPTSLTLRGSWLSTPLATGDIVHVSYRNQHHIGLNQPPGQVLVDDSETSPLLIVHPDHLLSATTVSDSFDCIRKAVLQDRIKATGETNKSMVYGKILHEIFQKAMSANAWTNQFLSDLVERTVQGHIEGLWELGMKDDVLAIEEVKAKMVELACWARIFVADEPGAESLVNDKLGSKVQMSISKLIAIEEHVWAPMFGLKGNIDATVQSSVVDETGDTKVAKRLIMPFEVKTGRTTQSPAHRAQTALYTLLLSDRYHVSVTAGILYYLESSNMSRIAPPAIEIRQMIQQRNRLACHVYAARYPKESTTEDQPVNVITKLTQESEESGLPPMLKNPFKCGKCYARESCFTFHALVENGNADSAGMVDDGRKDHSLVWQEAVGHLIAMAGKSQERKTILSNWFRKWDKLLTFEESELNRFRRELWTMTSSEREAVGRCFGNLVICRDLTSTATTTKPTDVDGIEGGGGGKINRFAYALQRCDDHGTPSFTEGSQIVVGEPIVISSEQGQWALANGYVVAVSKNEITVAVDRKLGSARHRLAKFDEHSDQAFEGIMTVGGSSESTSSLAAKPLLYRLDKDEFSNGLALVRNSLVTLMSTHPIHTKLRDRIIFEDPPQMTRELPVPLARMEKINDDQQAAVQKVMSSQDYALILGMPGTGKTTAITHIIRALVEENKSVLLTSFTHTAVDNILLRIKDLVPANSILRLGVPAKINPQVQAFCQLAATSRTTIQEIDEAYMQCKIVATTCMGTNHALFNRRSFDVCIVDEASQITLPVSLGPLLHARRFVLVGDHYQLPPLVQNRVAQARGLDVSLFRQLSESHPESVAALRRQYRMNEDIMTLANELIYNGQLHCGNEQVAQRQLPLADAEGLSRLHTSLSNCDGVDSDCWLRELTSPERRVVFAKTDGMGETALERLSAGSKNITNACEAAMTAQVVTALLIQGVAAREIGVITLYRSQITFLRRLFKRANINSEVEIDSADRFQGRDKECIVLSMVRANNSGIVGDLLKDWRRVNVALTRAKSKLIILGHKSTLGENGLLAKFVSLVEWKGWVYDLKPGDDICHGFDDGSQVAEEIVEQGIKQSKGQTEITATAPGSQKRAVLTSSKSAGNRNLIRNAAAGAKVPGKVITGSNSPRVLKHRKAKEQVALEILEDMVLDEL